MSLVEKLALGTVQFGLNYGISNLNGQTSEKEVINILNVSSQHGISMLDTAQAYGTSEEILGRFHSERFDIVTKIQPKTNFKPASVLVEESLKRLNLDFLYGVLFHSAESALSNPMSHNDLLRLKTEKRINKVGFSVYTPQELESLIKAFGIPDLVQVPFSHLDRRFESILIDLHNKGVEVHTRSTFLQGLFFMDVDEISSFFGPVKEYLRDLKNSFSDMEQLVGFLLSYVASRPFIDKVVLGVNNSQQLSRNILSLTNTGHLKYIDVPEISEEILLPYLWK
jgi:aryl-alcohol dehydrogenase-like predicted oxidoreductase